LDNDPSPVPGKDQWDVTIDHAGAGNGTSRLDAMGDSLDLAKFHDLISDEATTMGKLGDTDTLGQRRAKALGVIADRQASADLLGLIGDDNGTDDHANRNRDGDGNHDGAGAGEGDGDGDAASEGDGAGSHGAGKKVMPRKSYLKTRLYIHVNLADLATNGTTTTGTTTSSGTSASATGTAGTDCAGGHEPAPGMAETNLFGAVTVEKILDWIRDLGPDATLTPVIDTNRDWAVDQHDPPEAMREQVLARDRHCVFPHCSVDSRRCDLDHIESYDDTGPPGQTSPDKLAPLCRRHHLAKTHGRWSYVRNKDG
ncbi:HNH endonuclease signature motif containing protein, partial [Nocardioides sp. Root151]|uniref:HNH endonuclease signature motif containing protein n=1 Tax=Nocardioides sp. Root151 TaxID=1736475 RepID=UPI00138F5034